MTAAQFFSGLSWQNGGRIAFSEGGAAGCHADLDIRNTRPSAFRPPRLSREWVLGYGLLTLPLISTREQRTALALLRDARTSNNDFLSFLFYWQAMEVRGEKVVSVINDIVRRRPAIKEQFESNFATSPLRGRTLGNYLLDDCRHAIAHIKRDPGRHATNVDDRSERVRLYWSVRVAEELAEHFIRDSLQLKERIWLTK